MKHCNVAFNFACHSLQDQTKNDDDDIDDDDIDDDSARKNK